ncbi:hypothetical protein D9M71_464690 [compost metagenome]
MTTPWLLVTASNTSPRAAHSSVTLKERRPRTSNVNGNSSNKARYPRARMLLVAVSSQTLALPSTANSDTAVMIRMVNNRRLITGLAATTVVSTLMQHLTNLASIDRHRSTLQKLCKAMVERDACLGQSKFV